MSYLKLLKESGYLWGVLFIMLIISGLTYQSFVSDWTYIYAVIFLLIPVSILLYWNYKDYKSQK